MLLTIIWRGTFYDFRRTVERLYSWLSLHSRIKAGYDQQKLRTELIDLMTRHTCGDPDTYGELLDSLLIFNSEGKLVLNHKSFAKVKVKAAYHICTRACLIKAGDKTHLVVGKLQQQQQAPFSFERIVE